MARSRHDPPAVRLRFLGTGASGGTPGRGRSRRLESSALVESEERLLVDVTRDFARQAAAIGDALDVILLTHAHRDASGGVARLRSWWKERGGAPIRVLAHPATFERLHERYRRLDHLDADPVMPGRRRRVGSWTVDACEVPHASESGFPTYAWRLRDGRRTLVYASDVAELTDRFRRFAKGADVLVVDGAMYRRARLRHLRIDEDLPRLCEWSVGRIVLTQIGRSAPPHDQLVTVVADLCDRAEPAHDGAVIEL